MSATSWAVLQGTVLFSTMMAPSRACWATTPVTASKAVISVALPAPTPRYLVGVLTATRTMSASLMCLATSVEKARLDLRAGRLVSPSSADESVSEVGSLEIVVAREPSRATRTIS